MLEPYFFGSLSTIAVFYGNPGGVQLCEATCVANFSFFPIIVISYFHFFLNPNMDIIIMFYYMDFMYTVWSKLQAYILKCIKNVILRVQKVFSLNLYL